MTLLETSQNSALPPEPQQQTPDILKKLGFQDKARLLDDFEKKLKQCRDARIQFEKEWYMNLAFYFGKQWVSWASSDGSRASQGANEFSKLVEPPVPHWRVRLVANKIRPIIRKELAKINQERPRGFVIPQSTDDNDLAAARAAEAIHEHVTTQDMHLSNIVWTAAFWMVLCGTGFIKDWYDEGLVDSAGVQGRIMGEALSPFHLLVPDVETIEIEDQPYVIHTLAKDPDWVKQKFGMDVPADTKSNSGLLEQKFLTAIGADTGKTRDRLAVKEIWMKPTTGWPEGLVGLWAGQEILQLSEGHPYAHGEYPFTKIDHIPTGRFYGQSTIVDLIPLQKEYNRTRSQIIEAKNRMSKPQLAAAEGSINPKKITSEPGLIVFYKPGYAPPVPIPLQSIPGYVIEELDRSQRDMDDISSQHEVSKGRTPPGVEAATAIAYLQEQDDTVIAHTIQSVERAFEKIGKHVLSHAGTFWDAERMVRVVGKNAFFESWVFKNSDLRGNTDYKIEPGSALPVSRAAKQAQITKWIEMGLIPADRGLQFLGFGETARLYEEMQIDVRQAQRENLKMANGQPVPVNTYDNNPIHIMEHDSYRKRQEFEMLDDQRKAIFEQHCLHHKIVHMQQMTGMAPPEGDLQLQGVGKEGLQEQPPESDNGQQQMPLQGV